jgi:hypothetical protein
MFLAHQKFLETGFYFGHVQCSNFLIFFCDGPIKIPPCKIIIIIILLSLFIYLKKSLLDILLTQFAY